MSEQSQATTLPELPAEAPQKFVWQRGATKRVIEVQVHWPSLYANYEPWGFKFRLALSDQMMEKRDKWLGLPAGERNKREAIRSEIVDEVCDLLVDFPTGFGDLNKSTDLRSPSVALRAYYDQTTDPEQKETLYQIMEAANTGYWAKALPREFRT